MDCGVGNYQHISEGDQAGDWYGFDSTGDSADTFIRDGRVVLAMMNKIPRAAGENPLLLVMVRAITGPEDDLAIAINTACVEALTNLTNKEQTK